MRAFVVECLEWGGRTERIIFPHKISGFHFNCTSFFVFIEVSVPNKRFPHLKASVLEAANEQADARHKKISGCGQSSSPHIPLYLNSDLGCHIDSTFSMGGMSTPPRKLTPARLQPSKKKKEKKFSRFTSRSNQRQNWLPPSQFARFVTKTPIL